jgi:hypothetical protein
MKIILIIAIILSIVSGECRPGFKKITVLKTKVADGNLKIVRMVKKCVKESARKDGTKNTKDKK